MSGVVLLVTVVTVVGALLRRWLPWDMSVIAAAALVVGWAIGVGLTARPFQWHPLREQSQAVACLALLVVVVGGVRAAGRGEQLVASLPRSPWTAVAYLPVAVALVTAGVNAASPTAVGRWFAIVKDPSEHAWFVRQLRDLGELGYGAQGIYPRGLHALIALCETAAGQPETLDAQLTTTGAVVWLCLALCLASLTCLVMRLTQARTPRFRGLAGLATGSGLLVMNGAMTQFVTYGAHAGLLAIAVGVLPVLFTVIPHRGRRLALVVLPGVAALQAHLWSATIASSAVLGVFLIGWGLCHAPTSRLRTLAGDLMWVSVGLPFALAAVPPFVGLGGAGGLAVAGIYGSPVVPSWLTVALAVVGAGTLLRRCTNLVFGANAAVLLGYLAMMAVLLIGGGDPLNLFQWYPMKAAWFCIVASIPATVVGVAAIGGRLLPVVARSTGRLFGARAGAANVVLGTVGITLVVLSNSVAIWAATLDGIAVALPYTPVASTRGVDSAAGSQPSYAQASERRVDMARDYGMRYAPARSVPVELGYSGTDVSGTPIVGMLLRLQTGQPVPSSQADVCTQVRQVAGERPAVVITTSSPDDLRARLANEGCTARVEQLPWPGTTGVSR